MLRSYVIRHELNSLHKLRLQRIRSVSYDWNKQCVSLQHRESWRIQLQEQSLLHPTRFVMALSFLILDDKHSVCLTCVWMFIETIHAFSHRQTLFITSLFANSLRMQLYKQRACVTCSNGGNERALQRVLYGFNSTATNCAIWVHTCGLSTNPCSSTRSNNDNPP